MTWKLQTLDPWNSQESFTPSYRPNKREEEDFCLPFSFPWFVAVVVPFSLLFFKKDKTRTKRKFPPSLNYTWRHLN